MMTKLFAILLSLFSVAFAQGGLRQTQETSTATPAALLGECMTDCDIDTDCQPRLVCANNRGAQLQALGLDKYKAYCVDVGKLADEVCCNPNSVKVPIVTEVYVAEIAPIQGAFLTNVTGAITVNILPTGISYQGQVSGIEPNLKAANCNATNGCGVHIHDGTAFTDITAQGNHLFAPTLTADPWTKEKYSSRRNGKAIFVSSLDIGTQAVEGKPFVIHAANGTRVGCDILKQVFQL